MRIGIVTQPLEMNYGGILQNWALQQVLLDLGHEPITIDAYERYSTPHYVYNCMRTLWSRLKGKKIRMPRRYYGSLRKPMTGDFIERYISKTHVMWGYQRSVVRRYRLDAIVVGSDQVWRAKYNGDHLEDMYLKFVEGKSLRRVAYAASFGSDEWEYTAEQTSACSRLLKQMDAVSVREVSGVALCREHLGVEAQCVLDPTLLLIASEYDVILTDETNQKDKVQPYIAVYCLDVTPNKKAFCERLAQQRELEVRYFSGGWFAEISVNQWLEMLKNATMVVTDSFHGTVFSILFGKEFYTICNYERGNSRISGLFDQLGLGGRLLSETNPVEPADRVIDWAGVYSRLNEKRKESLEFLARSLQ